MLYKYMYLFLDSINYTRITILNKWITIVLSPHENQALF